MRILHTSDWHLGRTFHGCDLLPDQEQVLGHLADLVTSEAVDVVAVAGDIFDRALPSAEAVGVYDRALSRLWRAGAQIVLISGNHDSAARLGSLAGFAAVGGLHLHTRAQECARPTLLADEHGVVAFYGLPFLEPETARTALDVPDARGHEAVLRAAMDTVRADLVDRSAGTRSVVLAHAFVTVGAVLADTCDSERSLAVGGVQTAPSAVFDGVDYVALGHLHGCQQPDAARPWLHYSGSPLAYSFSERAQRKSVLIVDLGETGLTGVRRIELPVPRRLSSVAGHLADLVTAPQHEPLVNDYLRVVLTDLVRPVEPMRRLQERFPYALSLEWRPDGHPADHLAPTTRRAERDDLATAADFVEFVRNSAPTDAEQILLGAAFESLRTAGVAR
ncbi:exonuclease SbcCD subunit D [soil metagenome]